MPADALVTLGSNAQQAWYWPPKPEYCVSSLKKIKKLFSVVPSYLIFQLIVA